jgi:hypothetical protein
MRVLEVEIMARSPLNSASFQDTYELYKELADELLVPIENSIDTGVRYELYLSKLVYLENLQQQCFLSVNSPAGKNRNTFCSNDLDRIQKAIQSTHEFMRHTILEALEKRLSGNLTHGQEA